MSLIPLRTLLKIFFNMYSLAIHDIVIKARRLALKDKPN